MPVFFTWKSEHADFYVRSGEASTPLGSCLGFYNKKFNFDYLSIKVKSIFVYQ